MTIVREVLNGFIYNGAVWVFGKRDLLELFVGDGVDEWRTSGDVGRVGTDRAKRCWGRASLLAVGVLGLFAGPAFAEGAPTVSYLRDVHPILTNRCFKCHGPDPATRQAELRLDSPAGWAGKSSRGYPIVLVGRPTDSELFRRVTSHDTDERMPPAAGTQGTENESLSPAQIDILRRWIAEGARWQEHWAYKPPVRPEIPNVQRKDWVRTPIDAFVLAKLERSKLGPAAVADPITLVRRLYFDLTGLPPRSRDVDEFLTDQREDAVDRLVDRLLASPHFGERMAVHWLDLVRYGDSCGYHSDVDQPIWPYRDYVIESFNSNLRFDRFTREQLAGDLLPDADRRTRIASGYNRLNKTTEEGGAQDGEYRAKSAADRVRTTSSVWLAATLGCAECHDHKYDPLTTRDFYRFAAFFADLKEQGVYGAGGRDPVLLLPNDEQRKELDAVERKIATLEANIKARQQRMAGTAESTHEGAERAKQLDLAKKERQRIVGNITKTMVSVSGPRRETRILPRGQWMDQSGPIVGPATPEFLTTSRASSDPMGRLQLAGWIVSRDNPLTARVFVNRIWKLMFGAGLCRTLDNFGTQAELPTHPELLDWLAIEFMENGWDVKRLIRLIATSSAYRQSSIPSSEARQTDPENRLLSHQGRWRLDAEFIRDAALRTSGLLVPEIGGPSVKPYQPEGYWEFLNFPKRTWRADQGPQQYRRGLYTHWQRTFLHPSLLAFDAPCREECTADRQASNTPKSALALLNDPSFVEAARTLAARVMKEGGPDDASKMRWVWREALSRDPEKSEVAVLAALLKDQRSRHASDPESAKRLMKVGISPGPSAEWDVVQVAAWTAVCRAVLNLNEFVTRN